MHDDLARFVDSLAIPAERKAIVLAELADHVACAAEAAVREGRDPGAAAGAALGDLEALRASLEAIEPGFRISRWRALGRGLAAGLLVAVVLDQGGAIMRGVVGALLAVAIAAAFAPPHALRIVRAELGARRIPGAFGLVRGVPIGPVLTYGFTVMAAPFAVWIPLIVGRAHAGVTTFETPWAAFALPAVMCAVLLASGLRARRARTT